VIIDRRCSSEGSRVDFDVYRSVDGIKVAFVLRIATGQNVSTRTSVFAMPAER